ncbi:MAG TPA: hypothetical protein VHF51_14710 [Solirubrobacteraceae bacterium]|nr:hypothetical protein [Solirubrobacteraceae bacterium]
MTTATAHVSAAPVRAAATVVGIVLGLALAGAGLAAWSLVDRTPTVTGAPPFAGAWNARASFGPIRVGHVERAAATEFAGGHHTAEEKVDELRVSLEVSNRMDRKVPYSPGQFRLRLGETTVTSVRPNPPPDAIPAGQTVRQDLVFVVPARRAAFTLVFDDLARSRPLGIALGSLPTARKE